jgi:hypothetical protein
MQLAYPGKVLSSFDLPLRLFQRVYENHLEGGASMAQHVLDLQIAI